MDAILGGEMFGILGDIVGWFKLVVSLANWLILGAAISWIGLVVYRLGGLIGAGAAGAIVMFVAIVGGWIGDDSERVKRLEEENRALTAKKLELQLTAKELEKSLEDELAASEHNAGVMAEINKVITKYEADCGCDVGKDFTDLLKALK